MPRHKDTESQRVAGEFTPGSPAFWPQEDFPQGLLDGDLVQYNAKTGAWERVAKGDVISLSGLPDIADPNDGEVHLTPKASSSGAEGTIFYCMTDDSVYVGVE